MNRIQNRFRALRGTLLLQGPESKLILDSHFPLKESVDIGKYLDRTQWLESANRGFFLSGAPERSQKCYSFKLQRARASGTHPLVFVPTNINICLFQQFSLSKEWWFQADSLHKCGFSVRAFMAPTECAIVDRTLGLQDPTPISHFMPKVWVIVHINQLS